MAGGGPNGSQMPLPRQEMHDFLPMRLQEKQQMEHQQIDEP